MSDLCVLTGFKNVASVIELDRSSLACTDAETSSLKFEAISQH